MSIAPDRFPNFHGTQSSRLFAVLAVLLILTGCSSPKAAVPAVPSGSAAAEAVAPSLPARSDPGDQADAFIAAVRGANMSGYPQATIGQAFDAAFHDVHWQTRQPAGGARVVTFTGLLPAGMRPECAPANKGVVASPCVQDAKVGFEWTFGPRGLLFHLSHIDRAAWPETYRSTREMMLYIFG
ncbi:MAG: hypothetical protein ABI833_09800 [Acidobacteriota bacterium]